MPTVPILALPSPLAPRSIPEVRQLARHYASRIANMLTNEDEQPNPQATKETLYPQCLCGCGEDKNPKSRFKQGHDMKVNAWLNNVKAGTMDAASLPLPLVEAARNNPTLKVHDHVVLEVIQRSGNVASHAG